MIKVIGAVFVDQDCDEIDECKDLFELARQTGVVGSVTLQYLIDRFGWAVYGPRGDVWDMSLRAALTRYMAI